jgi:hypothetical protein
MVLSIASLEMNESATLKIEAPAILKQIYGYFEAKASEHIGLTGRSRITSSYHKVRLPERTISYYRRLLKLIS